MVLDTQGTSPAGQLPRIMLSLRQMLVRYQPALMHRQAALQSEVVAIGHGMPSSVNTWKANSAAPGRPQQIYGLHRVRNA